jgi:hypothetical protein
VKRATRLSVPYKTPTCTMLSHYMHEGDFSARLEGVDGLLGYRNVVSITHIQFNISTSKIALCPLPPPKAHDQFPCPDTGI